VSHRTERVAVVLKRSAWRKWVEEERDEQIMSLVETGDEIVQRMRQSHLDHMETVAEVEHVLYDLGAHTSWHDQPLDFRAEDGANLVVTVGGDGTLLAASHGIGPAVPLLGINSAPDHSVGFFCGAVKGHVREALVAALAGALGRTELTRMRVELSAVGRPSRVLNDRVLNEALVCPPSPAATSRFILRLKDEDGRVASEEDQKSSGLWIGPAAGSTAAQRSAGGRVLSLSSRKLQYVVREPYRLRGHPLRMARGLVGERQSLSVKSKMRQARLFLDGDHIVHSAAIGDVIDFRRSHEPLIVLGLPRDSRRR
jgi:NAD+ kinase